MTIRMRGKGEERYFENKKQTNKEHVAKKKDIE
jgi:hypothetical protein